MLLVCSGTVLARRFGSLKPPGSFFSLILVSFRELSKSPMDSESFFYYMGNLDRACDDLVVVEKKFWRKV